MMKPGLRAPEQVIPKSPNGCGQALTQREWLHPLYYGRCDSCSSKIIIIISFTLGSDVVGILDVDWQSLMSSKEPPKQPSSTDARSRFTSAHILSKVGISKKYAGTERVSKVQELLKQDNGELQWKYHAHVLCIGVLVTFLHLIVAWWALVHDSNVIVRCSQKSWTEMLWGVTNSSVSRRQLVLLPCSQWLVLMYFSWWTEGWFGRAAHTQKPWGGTAYWYV